MIKISYDDKQVREAVKEAERRSRNWKPMFLSWRNHYYFSRIEMFKSQGRSTGTPWPMYSRSTNEHRYAAVKASILGRRLTAADLMRWEGRNTLFHSLTRKGDPNSKVIETTNSISIGSKLNYAVSLSTGSYRMPEWAGSYNGVKRPIDGYGSYLNIETNKLTIRQKNSVEGAFTNPNKRQETYF